jgi:ferredoxin
MNPTCSTGTARDRRVFAVCAGIATVEFSRTGRVVAIGPEQSVLDAAEGAEIEIPFECRSGTCGQCKTHLLDGSVSMEVEEALKAKDRSAGLILACRAPASLRLAGDA